jgi:Plant transposon protein
MFDTPEETVLTVCMLMYVSVAAAVIVIFDEEQQVERKEDESNALMVNALQAFRRLDKRRRQLEAEVMNPQAKRMRKFDYERARACLYQDYLGPDALFERYYERVFRVSRRITDQLIQICGTSHAFFTQTTNKITGEKGIYPEAKVLLALKVLAFGVSPVALMDYFQMSDETGRKSVKLFCRIISQHPQLRQKYLRDMSKADAMRVSSLHQHEFGVRGCIGCLDCMHVTWKNCPSSWKGQYQGKEGSPTIILEAVADYNLWIWHTRFGFPGTLNDINVWDQSSLLRKILDGTFSAFVDFPFRIANKTFNKVWIMVDGIYPELARFVKTIAVPLSKDHKMYSKWQESCRKAVERAFGIVQRKFQVLTRPMEQFFEEDIRGIMETCLILHNMMVETRIVRDEQENFDWYEEREYPEEQYEVPLLLANIPPALPKLRTVKEKIHEVSTHWPDENTNAERAAAIKTVLTEHFSGLQNEWKSLYNRAGHYELRDAIIEQLLINIQANRDERNL